MILISHRGNIFGPEKEMENNPSYIEIALAKKFNVEIDIFFLKNSFWLGHNDPQYKIENIKWLMNPKLWCHAKNIEAIHELMNFSEIHSFWHQEDDLTITSKGYIWTYPGKQLFSKSIAVLQHKVEKEDLPKCLGICSDYVGYY